MARLGRCGRLLSTSGSFEEHLRRLRPGAVSIDERSILDGGDPPDRDHEVVATLVAAMACAARSAAEAAQDERFDGPIDALKKAIDGAATRSAEAVFHAADLVIEVMAGEGQRDESPGAYAGQSLGDQSTAGRRRRHGIFDYVDGTSLAARRMPGALSLGALGQGFRRVPDLQAYAVLAPIELAGQLDIMSPPEKHAPEILRGLSAWADRPVEDMVVVTHSIASHGHHRSLIRLLQDRVGQLIVPDPVTIEPPYLLSLAGITRPRIDTLMGAIGLCELAFASVLLDLLHPDYTFVFRMASIAGQRARPAEDLSPLWEFGGDELDELNAAGWRVDRAYTGRDIVAPGGAEVAAIFSITGDAALALDPVRRDGDAVLTQGLLVERGRVSRVGLSERL